LLELGINEGADRRRQRPGPEFSRDRLASQQVVDNRRHLRRQFRACDKRWTMHWRNCLTGVEPQPAQRHRGTQGVKEFLERDCAVIVKVRAALALSEMKIVTHHGGGLRDLSRQRECIHAK
jgi:hypothetical protein